MFSSILNLLKSKKNLHKIDTSNLGRDLQLGKRLSKLKDSTEFFAMVSVVRKYVFD